MKNTLLVTPQPHEDENLKGLVVRATQENKYDTPSVIFTLAGIRTNIMDKAAVYTEQQWDSLSNVLNVDSPTLQDMACVKGIVETPPEAYNFFGHRIHKYSYRPSAPKICPSCLREDNYIRKTWDIAAFTCCPEHKTLLIDKCPSCAQGLSWNRNEVSVCRCGKEWRDLFPPEVTEAETVLSRIILKVCGLPPVGQTPEKGTCTSAASHSPDNLNPLGTAGLGELLSAVYFIAGLKHGVVDTTGKQYVCKLPHDDRHRALTEAFTVFEDWPRNYHKFIEESRGKISMRDGASGLYKDFGRMYDPLFARKGNSLPEFMREAFKEYITTQWDGGYAGWCSSLSAEEQDRKKYMTRHEVAKYLNVSLVTVNKLHAKGYLKGEYQPWVNRSRIMIEADSVRSLKERWDKSINASEAGVELGVGRIAVASLVKSGCLDAIQGPSVTGQLEWKFEVSEVERLLKRMEDKITPDAIRTAETCVSFHKAIQKLSKLSIDVGAFINLILAGKIAPAAKATGTGLASLMFVTGEIERFSREEAAERRGNMRTQAETARLLRVSVSAVKILIKRKLLAARKVPGGRAGTWAIAQEEIDRFNETYVTMHNMVKALNTSPRGLFPRLTACGIKPITGPAIDGMPVHFFRRTDLEAIDPACILPVVKKTTMEKMNDKGFVSKKQLAELTNYPVHKIKGLIKNGEIIPAATTKREGGRTKSFFSHEQVERLKALSAEEPRQLPLFGTRPVVLRPAA